MTHRPTASPRIQAEPLEPRLLLAGDVTQSAAHLAVAEENVHTLNVGSAVYFYGGTVNARRHRISTAVDRYDALTGQWTHWTLPAAPGASAVVAGNDLAFVAQGAPSPLLITLGLTTGQTDTQAPPPPIRALPNLTDHLLAVGPYVLAQITDTDSTANSVETIDAFDTRTGQWTSHPLNRLEAIATVAADKALFVGGVREGLTFIFPGEGVDVFDASTGQWSTSTALSDQPLPDVEQIGNKVLYVTEEGALFHGGWVGSNTISVYDAAVGQWLPAGHFQGDVSAFVVAQLDDQVILAGGEAGGSSNVGFIPFDHVSAEVQIFHADTNQFTAGTLSVPREDIASATVGHLAVFAGGGYFNSPGGNPTPQRAIDVYNAQTGTWSATVMTLHRAGAMTAVAGNDVLIYGGIATPRRHRTWPMDVFHAATGQVTPTSPPVPLSDPIVISVGPDAIAYSSAGGAIDVYHSATGTWTTFPGVAGVRTAGALTVAGRALVYTDGGGGLGVYDPAPGTWSTLGLSAIRTAMAVDIVGNRVVFAGGLTDQGLLSDVVDILRFS